MSRQGQSWSLAAASSGLAAVGAGAVVCTANYLALPGSAKLDWGAMPLAIAMFVALSGLSIGLCIGGALLVAAKRKLGPLGYVGAGALGGVVAGLVPGVAGIAGFGSLDAPYAGTANIVLSVLVGTTTFVALWSPRVVAHRCDGGARHLLRSAIAAIVCVGGAGIMGWTLARNFDLIPTFDTMRAGVHCIGLLPLSAIVGASMGMAIGAVAGAACALVGRLGR